MATRSDSSSKATASDTPPLARQRRSGRRRPRRIRIEDEPRWLCVLLSVLLLGVMAQDTESLRWYRSLNLPSWTSALENQISAHVFTALLVAGVVIAGIGGRRTLAMAAVGLPVQFAVVQCLKHLIGRVRPGHGGDALLFIGPSTANSGFPSGHATAIFLLALVLTRRYPRFWPIWFGAPAVVGWARVHADAHFVGDVVAGVCVALAVERSLWYGLFAASPVEPGPTRGQSPSRFTSRAVRIALQWLAVVILPVAVLMAGGARPVSLSVDQAETIVTALYRQILNREPDPPGLATYREQLIALPIVMAPLKEMAQSSEFMLEIEKLPSKQRIQLLYDRLLDRMPQPDEVDAAMSLLSNPTDIRHAVRTLVLRITISREYLDRFGCFRVPGGT